MYFAIRDDDTSFFTKPEELEKAYDFIEKGPISLSVVPYTVLIHKDSVFPYGMLTGNRKYNPLDENKELVDYLSKSIKAGKYDVLMHGYTHEYKYINNQWVAEMKWKGEEQLNKELFEGKNYLEKILSSTIRVFVAPNNSIDRKAVSVISKLKMDYSGIIGINDRSMSFLYIYNFFKRWRMRIINKIPYPGILDYGDHKELVAYTIDNVERLKMEYLECKKRNVPFVFYTHYWQVNSDPSVKKNLKEIYEYLIKDGAELISLSKCFNLER